MNKIVLQFGLLVFSLSLIFFSRLGLPFEVVILKSFFVFVFTTVLLSIVVLVFVRAINKESFNKNIEYSEKINRK